MSTTTSTDEDDSSGVVSAHDHGGNGQQPKPYGRVHPTLQEVLSPVDSISSLREYLGCDDPLLNWQTQEPSGDNHEDKTKNLTDWFPNDDKVAFYTPRSSSSNQDDSINNKNKYDSLTYEELQQQLQACPTFLEEGGSNTSATAATATSSTPKVAIVIPVDQMADTAMTLLSVIANGGIAVPLDPRMPTKRILEAMEQLECTTLVATKDILLSSDSDEDEAENPKEGFLRRLQYQESTASDSNSYYKSTALLLEQENLNLKEIRIVQGGVCGRIQWTCLIPSLSDEEDDVVVWREMTAPSKVVSSSNNEDKSRNAAENHHHHPLVDKPAQLLASLYTCGGGNDDGHNNSSFNVGVNEEEERPSGGNDVAMLLRTSGTTNKPKVVPISHNHLIYAGVSIATALRLSREDCNANSMPFYHIGGISCNLLAVLVSGGSVLLAGPLKDPNMFLDHILVDSSYNNDNDNDSAYPSPTPTWYYAGPSMHKAIVLMAEGRYRNNGNNKPLSNHLRFVRNAAAHLNHDLALQISTIFGCQVIPTYGMSEAMPICSSAPIDVRNNPPCQVIDSVGYPAGTSVRIVDPETDQVLPYYYGEDTTNDNANAIAECIGEICVKGAGVISHYIGLDPAKTHTPDGWLRTGDHGILDRQGRLFIKGRSKEMIKRGGEQVWPNEIDDVVEKVSGVATAVAFGVPNELWGEEVAVAVVLKDPSQKDDPQQLQHLNQEILQTCRDHLDDLSMPQQIKFLSSTDELLKGSTGKYIRSKMASHLQVTAVDTGALRVLSSVSQIHQGGCTSALVVDNSNDDDQPVEVGKWVAWLLEWLESKGILDWLLTKGIDARKVLESLDTKANEGRRVIPSDALNGVRFLVSCFVVHVHVGRFPNLTWVKFQGFIPNMMVFFSLSGFQTTCQVARSVKGQWANFVGTKIGALHSLFVVSQLITFPSYVFFHAFDDDGNMIWDTKEWVGKVIRFIFSTTTGLGHAHDVNMFAWFQSALYIFLVFFPFLDHYLRYQTLKRQLIFLVVFGLLASGLYGILYLSIPTEIFFDYVYHLGWTIITWFPLLVTNMLLAYLFLRLVEYYLHQQKEQKMATLTNDAEMQQHQVENEEEEDPDTIAVEQLQDQTQLWGKVCDTCSFALLLIWIGVAAWPNCLCVYSETFEAMRPNEPLPEPGCKLKSEVEDYGDTCDITYDEFMNYIQNDPHHFDYGRFVTNWAGTFGYMRVASIIFAVWVATMAFGQGYTVRIFSSKLMTTLAPLGYPVYMLQMAVARYYWLATRGFQRQEWWGFEGEYPFPVQWYEFFLILFITVVVGGIINQFIVPHCMPYSITLGVRVCSWISWFASGFARKCLGLSIGEEPASATSSSGAQGDAKVQENPTYVQVKSMVRGLTGVDVTSDMPLRHLGLDSLGAAALLGTLRSSVPAARKLTLRQLQDCDTVGDLCEFLDSGGSSSSSNNRTKVKRAMNNSEETPSVSAETPENATAEMATLDSE